jgi:hypothetical protein
MATDSVWLFDQALELILNCSKTGVSAQNPVGGGYGDLSFVIGPSYVGNEQRPITHPLHSLFLNIIRVKFAIAVELNDHGTFLRRNKMRYADRDDDETACGVPFQICQVEFRSLTQIPGSFDDGDQFVLRVRVREDTFAGRHLDTITIRFSSINFKTVAM